jgi:ketosteroid isomerase-like protein
MSEENVQLVRRTVEAFNERDFPTLELLFTEDFLLRVIGGLEAITGREFRGQEAALDWIRDLLDTIGGRIEIETLREVNDQLLLIAMLLTSGTASGAEATWRIGQVYSCRDGRLSALDSFYMADDALEAVGLAE